MEDWSCKKAQRNSTPHLRVLPYDLSKHCAFRFLFFCIGTNDSAVVSFHFFPQEKLSHSEPHSLLNFHLNLVSLQNIDCAAQFCLQINSNSQMNGVFLVFHVMYIFYKILIWVAFGFMECIPQFFRNLVALQWRKHFCCKHSTEINMFDKFLLGLLGLPNETSRLLIFVMNLKLPEVVF